MRDDPGELVELLQPIEADNLGHVVDHRHQAVCDHPGAGPWPSRCARSDRVPGIGCEVTAGLDRIADTCEPDRPISIADQSPCSARSALGARIGELQISLRLEHHHRRGQIGQGDPQQLLLVPKAEFAPAHLFVHGPDGIQNLGEIGFPRPANQSHRFAPDQSPREIHEIAEGDAQTSPRSGPWR